MASAERKRKGNVSLQDWVAEKLECPVCLETIKYPPVFLCNNRHELCHKCRKRLKAERKPCPVCNGELTNAMARAVEKMLEELPKTYCKHEGCTFSRSDTELVKSHEERDCRMKPVKCEVCHQKIALFMLYYHMVEVHKRTPCHANLDEETPFITRLKKNTCGLDDYQDTLDVVSSTRNFFINKKQYNKTLTMFWISICGTQKEADEYEYTIKIENSAKNRAKQINLFTGKRDCVSCDLSCEEMKEKRWRKEGALFLNKDMLESAAMENDEQFLKFSYTLVIKKK